MNENKKNDEMEPFGDSDDKHKIGDEKCTEGWCSMDGYPKKHSCGGLIHANFGDENDEGDYWLYTKCDKCGESE